MMKSSRLSTLAMLFLASASFALSAQTQAPPPPSPGLMPNPTLGKRLYAENCASCHGQDLRGTQKGPPFLHPVYAPSHHGDLAFQRAVKNGSRAHHWKFGNMLPVPALTADDVAHITAYVRQQQRKAGIR